MTPPHHNVHSFFQDDFGFDNYVDTNPRHFVINDRPGNKSCLHTASCWRIVEWFRSAPAGGAKRRDKTRFHEKHCAADLVTLHEFWADRGHGYGFPKACGTCHPLATR